MRPNRAALAVMLLMAIPLLQTAEAEPGSLVLFAEYNDRVYAPGETVDFTISVYSAGSPAVPDEAPTVYVLSTGFSGRTLPLCGTGTGRYAGQYTVLSSDAYSGGMIMLQAKATRGRSYDQDPDYDLASVYFYINLEMSNPSGYISAGARITAAPGAPLVAGSTVRMDCCITSNGQNVDTPGVNFSVRRSEPDGRTTDGPVLSERQGTGQYTLVFRVPRLNYSTLFDFYASGPDNFGRKSLGVILHLDFATVVFRELRRSGTRLDYEVIVSDLAGRPVNGSAIRMELEPYTGQKNVMTLEPGKTNGQGRVKGILDMGPDVGAVSVRGWANSSRFCQRFGGSLHLNGTSVQQPPEYGNALFVTETGRDGGNSSNPANSTMRAFFNRELYRNQPIDIYLHLGADTTAPVKTVSLRQYTDGGGNFVLPLPAIPDDGSYVYAAFRAPASVSTGSLDGIRTEDGRAYSEYTDFIWPVYEDARPLINATVKGSEPGKKCTASVRDLPTDTTRCAARWDFSEPSAGQVRTYDVMACPETVFNGTPALYSGKFVLPSYLKPSTNLSLEVTMDNSSGYTTLLYSDFRVRGLTQAAPESDLCCLLAVAMVNVILVSFLVISYVMGRRQVRPGTIARDNPDAAISFTIGDATGPHPALPLKVTLKEKIGCAVCNRPVAGGNTAFRCICGKTFHEHCAGEGKKCPSCGREWTKR